MQKSDYEWFLKNYDSLFQEYGQSFLVIKDSKVLGSYSSYADGVNRTLEHEPLGTFIVQFCNGNDSAYTNHIASMNFMEDSDVSK